MNKCEEIIKEWEEFCCDDCLFCQYCGSHNCLLLWVLDNYELTKKSYKEVEE